MTDFYDLYKNGEYVSSIHTGTTRCDRVFKGRTLFWQENFLSSSVKTGTTDRYGVSVRMFPNTELLLNGTCTSDHNLKISNGLYQNVSRLSSWNNETLPNFPLNVPIKLIVKQIEGSWSPTVDSSTNCFNVVLRHSNEETCYTLKLDSSLNSWETMFTPTKALRSLIIEIRETVSFENLKLRIMCFRYDENGVPFSV